MLDRRKESRTRILPKFRVKARVRSLQGGLTHYFLIENLSMGGLCLISRDDVDLKMKEEETFEILIFQKNLSLRLTAQVLGSQGRSYRARIIGIDEKSREMLAKFLNELARTEGIPLATS